jgi:hypothetical protein
MVRAMSRLVILADRATRQASRSDLVRSCVVGGCALALILARVPFGL